MFENLEKYGNNERTDGNFSTKKNIKINNSPT